jgi:hypothetical protein
MAVWDTLKIEVQRALDEHPHELVGYPDPRSDRGRDPPLSIEFAPWATELAGSFHDRFGADVRLQVGALSYPDGMPLRVHLPALEPEVDPSDVEVAVDPPLVVRSGRSLRSELLVRNRTDGELRIKTNGIVTAYVVDPATGSIVGGYSGFQTLPLVTFRVAPGAFEPIPLLVGTATFVPGLGYAVPPGSWNVRVPLKLGDGRHITTPSLPITVTD